MKCGGVKYCPFADLRLKGYTHTMVDFREWPLGSPSGINDLNRVSFQTKNDRKTEDFFEGYFQSYKKKGCEQQGQKQCPTEGLNYYSKMGKVRIF